jgi:hypothetical protein
MLDVSLEEVAKEHDAAQSTRSTSLLSLKHAESSRVCVLDNRLSDSKDA